jgi:hypothetical protein
MWRTDGGLRDGPMHQVAWSYKAIIVLIPFGCNMCRSCGRTMATCTGWLCTHSNPSSPPPQVSDADKRHAHSGTQIYAHKVKLGRGPPPPPPMCPASSSQMLSEGFVWRGRRGWAAADREQRDPASRGLGGAASQGPLRRLQVHAATARDHGPIKRHNVI